MSAVSRSSERLSLCIAVGLDVLLTAATSALQVNFAASGFLHLLLVVVVAFKMGFLPATITSLAANLGLNFFLVRPTRSFSISDPQNLVAVVVFEVCALVVSQLSANAEFQRDRAVSRERELEKLCSFSRRLLLMNRLEGTGVQILRLVKDEFKTRAAFFMDGSSASVQSNIDSELSPEALAEMKGTLSAAYFQNRDFTDSDSGLLVRVMRLGSNPIGVIGLRGALITPSLATTISVLGAIALERERSLDREAQKAAEQQGEQLRVAVLDALAHEYKTPLTVIRTAAGGLLEIGRLEPVQFDLIQLINLQTSKLNVITSELLQSSRLDVSHTGLKLELIAPDKLIGDLKHQMEERHPGRTPRVDVVGRSVPIIADRQLLLTALSHYVDNAVKYSPPESSVTVCVKCGTVCVTFSVHNVGSYIAPAERERVFDRFHRGHTAGQNIPGSGIGLSIVRKVANAHRGRAWVTSDETSGTTFLLSVPIKPKDWSTS